MGNNDTNGRILILTDGKAGHENQSRAFARALGRASDLVEIHFRSRFHKALSYLFDRLGLRTTALFDASAQPIGRLVDQARNQYEAVIGTGSGTFYAAKAVARRLGVRCGVVLYPRGYDIGSFDCVLAPSFDRPKAAPNVVEIPANLVAADAAFYEKGVAAFREHYRQSTGRPLPDPADAAAVIVGGPNKCSTMSVDWMKGELDRLFASGTASRYWVTTSRRTPPEVEALIDSYPWDYRLLYSKDHFNPIPAFVSLARCLCVTAESTGMISEACTSGTAEVRVLDNLNPGPSKFRRFVDGLRADGYVDGNRKVDLAAPFARARSLMRRIAVVCLLLASDTAFASPAPETWFHIIGGNASREGLVADIRAIADAGFSGIQFFHGGWKDDRPWPGVKEMIPCLSEKWLGLVRLASEECARRGLTFKMQNCPGWSMSGGPWVTPDRAMRKLVCFEPGQAPAFDAEDDYREIGTVTFPWNEASPSGRIAAVTFPNPQQINHPWAYEPDADLVVCDGAREIFRRTCPRGAWHDIIGMTFRLSQPLAPDVRPADLRAAVQSRHGTNDVDVVFRREPAPLDNWESKAGWGMRSFEMSTNATPIAFAGTKTLVFGHVNAKVRNHPAPPEATGWECDKMDARGFEANWQGYLGRVLAAGVKVDGTLVDSWECGVQSWTWKMEEAFERMNGYALRPWLPALFGYVLRSEAETERFLLDWRRTCSRLVEEGYYGTIARLAHANGMKAQYETSFGDVLIGDVLRYWKYADEPMCEFWSPFDNEKGFVTSHEFKSVRPCVSAAHVYGKRRVSAESFTSLQLTFNESFQELKRNANRHFARGVTHLVFHTYTHNPVIGGKAPGSSFGNRIGSPFLRLQPWWGYMPELTRHFAVCGRELERGRPVVDILRYLGDAMDYRPSERDDGFGNRYKCDYLNGDALMTRLDVKDGRLVFPDGMNYRVLWIPSGTFLLPETERRLSELAARGARIVRGELTPDWPADLDVDAANGEVFWYHRRDGETDIYFVSARERGFRGTLHLRALASAGPRLDLTADESCFIYVTENGAHCEVVPTVPETYTSVPPQATPVPLAWERPPCVWTRGETNGTFVARFAATAGRLVLDLGGVCHWATVRLNGRTVAKLWCEPFRCELTPFVRAAENVLEIDVTAPIHNRLVLDAAKPEAERATWTLYGPTADAPLCPAGLPGPVRLLHLPVARTAEGGRP